MYVFDRNTPSALALGRMTLFNIQTGVTNLVKTADDALFFVGIFDPTRQFVKRKK